MARGNGGSNLVKLEDFDSEIAEHWRGAKGSEVLDKNGDAVGTVEEIYVWPETGTAHLLKVSTEGRAGLLPVHAVRNVDEEGVKVEEGKETMTTAPEYGSADVPDDEVRKAAFGHFGYADPMDL